MQEIQKDIEIEKESLELARKSGDRENEMNHLRDLGVCYHKLGQIDQAIKYHKEALAVARETDNLLGELQNLDVLGRCY